MAPTSSIRGSDQTAIPPEGVEAAAAAASSAPAHPKGKAGAMSTLDESLLASIQNLVQVRGAEGLGFPSAYRANGNPVAAAAPAPAASATNTLTSTSSVDPARAILTELQKSNFKGAEGMTVDNIKAVLDDPAGALKDYEDGEISLKDLYVMAGGSLDHSNDDVADAKPKAEVEAGTSQENRNVHPTLRESEVEGFIVWRDENTEAIFADTTPANTAPNATIEGLTAPTSDYDEAHGLKT